MEDRPWLEGLLDLRFGSNYRDLVAGDSYTMALGGRHIQERHLAVPDEEIP